MVQQLNKVLFGLNGVITADGIFLLVYFLNIQIFKK